MMVVCKECGVNFENEKGLHLHLRRHKLKIKSYYERYYPMVCLQTGRKLSWRDGDTLENYLSRRFVDKTALYQYFEKDGDLDAKKSLIIKYLEDFYHKHQIAPCQMELCTLPMFPNLLIMEKYLNYAEICKTSVVGTRFDYNLDYTKPLPIKRIDPKDFCILIDSRERNPYRLCSSVVGKIDVGDYALAGQNFNGIVVDRKEIGDFWNTMAGAIDKNGEPTRFQRELERAKSAGQYVIILCEYNLHLLDKYKSYGFANYSYIAHNMRNIFRQYHDCCQFVFTISRDISAKLLIEFLLCGDVIKKYDLQYWVDKHYPPFRNQEFSEEDLVNLFGEK